MRGRRGVEHEIDQPGDVDRFIFTAKAAQRFTFLGVNRSQGSPSQLNLRLLKADAAEVAASDDNNPNEALIDFLAEVLKTSRSAVSILSGKRSRVKRIEIRGVTRQQVLNLLLHEA